MLKIRLWVIRFVLIGLAILGYVEAWGADWILIKTTDEGNFLYDAENITRPSKNTVGIWLKLIYSEKVKGRGDLDNLSQTVGLWEINCADKMIRLLSMSHYSKEEEMLYPSSPRILLTPDWESIGPDTPLQAIYTKVCK
jgi:hypothetical protein